MASDAPVTMSTGDVLEFDDFFAAGEGSSAAESSWSPRFAAPLEDEDDSFPHQTPELLARRQHLRRLVTRIVAGLGAATALIFAKEALFPPPTLADAPPPPALALPAAATVAQNAPSLVTQVGALTPDPEPQTPESQAEVVAPMVVGANTESEDTASSASTAPEPAAPLSPLEQVAAQATVPAARVSAAAADVPTVPAAAVPAAAAGAPTAAAGVVSASTARGGVVAALPVAKPVLPAVPAPKPNAALHAPKVVLAAKPKAVVVKPAPTTRGAMPDRRAARTNSSARSPHSDSPTTATGNALRGLPASAGFPIGP